MAKIMIDERVLEDFEGLLMDIQFKIRLVSDEKVGELLDELWNAWGSVYDCGGLTIKRGLRKIYGEYIKAKNSGDMENAKWHLENYRELKNRWTSLL